MRHRLALLGVLILTVATALAAQQKRPITAQNGNRTIPAGQRKFLAAGPFLFSPDAIHPTYMDWLDNRPVVESPDGKLGVSVTGPKESWGAWVTINPSEFPDGPIQVWPIQRDVDVLWRPDSQAFALTDNRYANDSYVLVFGTRFQMGENGPELGVPVTDLTPVVEKAFEKRAQGYYASADHGYETRLFYAKVLRWIGNDELLVGVSAMTVGPATFANRGIMEWSLGYVVDVSQKTIVRELSESQLLSQYGIKVAK